MYRRFPDALEVQFEEYEPAAVVQATDGRRWLVADDGQGARDGTGTVAGNLALIVPSSEAWPQAGGVVAPQIVAALARGRLWCTIPGLWPASHPVKRLVVDDFGEVVLVLGSGAEVRIGEPTRLQQKLMVAASIIDRKLREGQPDRVCRRPRSELGGSEAHRNRDIVLCCRISGLCIVRVAGVCSIAADRRSSPASP